MACDTMTAGMFRGYIVLVLLLLIAVPVIADEEPGDAVDGIEDIEDIDAETLEVVDGSVEVETPTGIHMFYQAYIAAEEDVSSDEIADWERVEVDASLYAPDNVWDLQLGAEPQLFRDTAEVDLSTFDPGEYYIFLWGCGTEGLAGGQYIPGDCEWIDPFYVEKDGEELYECEQQGLFCANPGITDDEPFLSPESYDCPDQTQCFDVEVDALLSGHMTAGENPHSLAPEMTMQSVEVAEQIEMDSGEFDVRLTGDDELVVFHDANTGAVTGEDIDVADATLDELTQLTPDHNYEYHGDEADDDDNGYAQYAIPPGEASQSNIVSFEEMVQAFADSDQLDHMRVDIKYPIEQNQDDSAREVYRIVEQYGMANQAVFMQFQTCERESWTMIGADCGYPALDAIKDESGGSAETVVMWQSRRNAGELGGWRTEDATVAREYSLQEAIEAADAGGHDIVSARDSFAAVGDPICAPDWVPVIGGNCYNELGIQGESGMTRDDFVDEVQSRGMGYAFMSYAEDREHLLDNYPEVEWLSGNRIDLLKEAVEDYEEDRLEEFREDFGSDFEGLPDEDDSEADTDDEDSSEEDGGDEEDGDDVYIPDPGGP